MSEHLPTLDVAGQTDVGLKRSRNEDTFRVLMPPPDAPQAAQGALFLVADGMGGMGGGDVASKAAVDEIIRRFYDPAIAQASLWNRVEAALDSANRFVREQAQTVGLPRIGATAAGLALLPDGNGIIFNVGDARAYRVRQGVIERLSTDQSVLENQIGLGLISEEEARRGKRNVNVTAFIGQPMALEANYREDALQDGDIYILCSDGLWDLVTPDEIMNVVQKASAAKATRRLIAMARKRGAPDNVTVIVIRAGPAPRDRSPLLLGGAVAAIAAVAVIAALVLGGAGGASDNEPTEVALVALVTPEATSLVVVSIELPTEAEPVTETVTAGANATDTPRPTVTRVPATATPQPETEVALVSTERSTATDTEPPPSPTDRLTATRVPPTATDLPTQPPAPTSTPAATLAPTLNPTRAALSLSQTHLAELAATSLAAVVTRPPAATRLTATATPTPSPTDTPSPVPTSTPTATPTPSPTATPTPSPTDTPTPTATASPTVTPTPSPLPPTATLNPTVITWTPAPTTGTPVAIALGNLPTRAELLSRLALTEGVRLESPARLLVIPPGYAKPADEIPLEPGTAIVLVDTIERVLMRDGIRLRHVKVLDGPHQDSVGWLAASAIAEGTFVIPRAYVEPSSPSGVNLRAGASVTHAVIGGLQRGEFAQIIALSRDDTDWILVRTDDGEEGWLNQQYVKIDGDLTSLPLVSPPPPPTATLIPTPAPRPTEAEFLFSSG